MIKEKIKNTKIYIGFQRLRADMKPMTFKEKREHIWEYYKEWLIVVFMIAIGLGVVFSAIAQQNKEVLVSGMMVNISIDQRGMNYLTTEYAQYLGATSKNQVAEMDYTSFGNLLDPQQGDLYYNLSLVLPARVSGKLLDYMILDKSSMEFYIIQDVYMDLRDFFTEAELAQLDAENRVIYAQQEGDFDRRPIAVAITELPFIQEYVAPEDDIYFALSGSSPRPEMCRNVWNYLHAWEKPENPAY